MSGKNSVLVAIKVRPVGKDQSCNWRVVDNSIQLVDGQAEPYYFDHIFDQDATNQIIFDKMAKQIVHSAIEGFNGTIFAYGQTSSGKTYTMMGDEENPGVMVLAAKEIFNEIKQHSDRQFLLRVGYIEIYNEKIYDLLNKKNQDLKLHETAGMINVNCEEIIITCEDDLLNHLIQGSKERTVAETNMNERSSRSHAIFRIIIESRKIDRSEDDTVKQSIINLVDLAGSERAGQTKARGTVLKEAGHINKSLFFLGKLIKGLSENEDKKYVCYRDSKLTRILQDSLGGNTLTAIICTIKPNATEETQSTLSFALRAKVIKNKPAVNELVSDATMMKRLEKEITVLKSRLEEERRKNESQIKVGELEKRIKNEVLKIITSHSLPGTHNSQAIRRRTWCPMSADADNQKHLPSALPLPTHQRAALHHLQPPKISSFLTPHITLRSCSPTEDNVGKTTALQAKVSPIGEEYIPGELVDFDKPSSLQTPKQESGRNECSVTPKLFENPRLTLEKIESEFMELQKFTNIENKIDVKYHPEVVLKQKLETLTERNIILENQRLEYMLLKDEFSVTRNSLTESEKRCEDLQKQVAQLFAADKIARETINRYENNLSDLKSQLQQLEMENRNAVNLDFELERLENKSKLRETELLEVIREKEDEILKLEKSLKSLVAGKLQNTKEFMQTSLRENFNTDEKVPIKCEDLQEMLAENEKVTRELQKLKLEYERLELNYKELLQEKERNLNAADKEQPTNKDFLQEDIQTLREKLQAVQQAYDQLSEQIATDGQALNENPEDNVNAMKMLQDKYQKLENSWQEQQQSLNDIQAQYDAVQSKYLHLQNKYERLEISSEKSLADREHLQNENEKLESDIKDLKQLLEEAQVKLLEKPEITNSAQKEISELKVQLNELQIRFEDLQKECDDLSSQLMDNLQENDSLKAENTKLIEDLTILKDKNSYLSSRELENVELKAKLERLSFSTEKQLLNYSVIPSNNSSLRSSGVGVEDEEERIREEDTQKNFLKKFVELSASFNKIELELTEGNVKIFQTTDTVTKPHVCKLHLNNIKKMIGFINDQQDDAARFKGTLNQVNFEIGELKTDDLENTLNNSEVSTGSLNEYQQKIESLQDQINKERLSNKFLLENTERTINEMKEQIIRLNGELMEKSVVVEKCACESYQKKICDLEKEKAQMHAVNEELLQNNASDDAIIVRGTCEECKDCKNWQVMKLEMEVVIEDLTQRYLNLQKQFEQLDQEHKAQIAQLGLINTEKLELNSRENHQNLKECCLEDGRNEYKTTIYELKQQSKEIEGFDIEEIDNETTNQFQIGLVKKSPNCENVENLEKTPQGCETLAPEQLQECKDADESEKSQHMSGNDEYKIKLLEQELIDKKGLCEEYETEIQELRKKIKSFVDQQKIMEKKLNELFEENQNLTDQQNIISTQREELREKILSLTKEIEVMKVLNYKLRDLETNNEQLALERDQLLLKLLNAEQQVSEFCKEDAVREEIIQDLQNKLNENQTNFLQSYVPLEVLTALRKEKLEVELELQREKQENEKLEKRLMETEDRENKQRKYFTENIDLITEEKRNLNEKLMLLVEEQAKSLEEKNALEKQKKFLHQEKAAAEQKFLKVIEEKMQQLKELQQTCDNLTQEFIHKQEKISTLTRIAEELRENESQNLKTIKTLDNENKILKAQKLKCEEQLNELNQKSSNLLKDEIDSLKEEKKNLEEKLDQLTEIEKQKAALEELHKRSEAKSLEQNDNLKEQLALLQEEKLNIEKKLKEEYVSLTAICKELKDRENKQQMEMTLLHEQIQLLNEEKTKFTEKLQQLEEKKNSLEKEVQTIQQEKLLAETKFEKLTEENCHQMKKLQENCDHLNQAHIDMRQKICISEVKLKELEEKKNSLEKEVQTLQQEKLLAETKLQKLTEENYHQKEKLQANCDHLNQAHCVWQEKFSILTKQLEKYEGVELKNLRQQNEELLESLGMEVTVKEADRCEKDLSDEAERYKQLLGKQVESYNNLRQDLLFKEMSFKAEKEKLNSEIATLENEKLKLEVRIKEIIVKNVKQDLEKPGSSRPSFEGNVNADQKLNIFADNIQHKNKIIERKNRRSNVHDERRCQSYWGTTHDKATMTTTVDTKCRCEELDEELQECKRNLYIRQCQVGVLNKELKYHPLKDENDSLIKRIQEEQNKYCIERKRYEQRLHEQTIKTEKALSAWETAKKQLEQLQNNTVNNKEEFSATASTAALTTSAATRKELVNVEAQTDGDLNDILHTLEENCRDLRKLCRMRYKTIQHLEEKVSQKENPEGNYLSALEAGQIKSLKTQIESLKDQLKTVHQKYTYAKVILQSRREENQKLKQQLENLNSN
uniref:Kinesin motor domain-containing protein n=1 Tax=Glossina brevipalpis TaxID=37001 RepID=A0A1A9W0R9_9MUSC